MNSMQENNLPEQSWAVLLLGFFSALLLAFILLITVVSPAEFGIDPTGLGKKMGLLALAQSSIETEKSTSVCPVGEQAQGWQDIVVISLPPQSGLEYKFFLAQNAKLNYSWHSNNVELYYDFHGEPENNQNGYFKSYQEQTGSYSLGELQAPFTGTHGWYWENKGSTTAYITLKSKGEYQIKGLM